MLIETGIGEFSDAQALTNGTTASTNVLNIGVARHQFGADNLWLWLRVNVAANFSAAETYLFSFIVDTVENFASPKTVLTISDSDGTAIVEADPEATCLKTAGLLIWASTLPYSADEQFARWDYTLADGGGTASITVDAALGTAKPPTHREGNDAVYVSNVGNP